MPDIRDLLSDAAGAPSDGFDADHVRRRVRQRARRRQAAGGVLALTVFGLTALAISASGEDDGGDDQVVAGEVDTSVTVPDAPVTTTTPTTVAPAPTTPAPTTAAPPTTAVAPPTTPTTTAPAPAPLEDGRHFGYVVGYGTAGATTLAEFDLAQLFVGDEAGAAAAEDGAIGEGEELERDFYIRNTNPRIRTVPFAGQVAVTVVECDAGCESVAADLGALQDRARPTPVWLTVADGVITAADEQYLP